jgi:hypothetical protein
VRRIVLAVVIALSATAHAGASPANAGRAAAPEALRSTIDPAKIEQARAAVLTQDFQPTLPGEGSADATGDPTHMRGDGRELGPDGRPRRDVRYVDTRDIEHDEPGPMSHVFAWIMWAIVIVGAALLIFWIGAELLGYGGDDAAIAQDASVPAAPDLSVIQRPLGDAEELARRGEYREAIHTLLLRTLQELARTASVRVHPAMTSREILSRVPLLADARDALAGLITAVELTHFGGDDATEADYLRCRAQFQVFAAAFRGHA